MSVEEAGGETACWAHLVCPECGRVAETTTSERCEACDADSRDTARDVTVAD